MKRQLEQMADYQILTPLGNRRVIDLIAMIRDNLCRGHRRAKLAECYRLRFLGWFHSPCGDPFLVLRGEEWVRGGRSIHHWALGYMRMEEPYAVYPIKIAAGYVPKLTWKGWYSDCKWSGGWSSEKARRLVQRVQAKAVSSDQGVRHQCSSPSEPGAGVDQGQ